MKACVYTYLFGAYDQLLPQPIADDSDLDFICFTDDPTLTSDTWQIHVIPPRYPTDTVRSARYVKILGDDRLAEYDVTLCIDASVLLKVRPEEIIATWLGEYDVALAQHSYREQVLDEFDEVVRLNYDDRARVHEQLMAYSLHHAPELSSKPLWTGMMVRRRTPEVERAMRVWFDHVLRYSRRDQLSVSVALASPEIRVARLPLDNFETEFHKWPVLDGRRISQGKAPSYPSGPLVAELRRRQRRLDELQTTFDRLGIGLGSLDELSTTVSRMSEDLSRAASERAQLEGRVQELHREVGTWHERWSAAQGITGASANWLRAVKSALRPGKS
ncbi:UNVERIFIED_CONTAM: DUF616 domain-containing protein [Microbacterium sp. SLM126]